LSVYFNSKYLEEGVRLANGRAGMFGILADSPAHVSRVAHAVDDLFHNAPQPTRTETERAFMLDFVAMMGNVKAFIVGICSAVIFTTLLVSANTMAMSIRERTREVSVLKTLGFTQPVLLGLFVGEAVGLVRALAATDSVSGPSSHFASHPRRGDRGGGRRWISERRLPVLSCLENGNRRRASLYRIGF
jgi:putative ABC transport system permease protein